MVGHASERVKVPNDKVGSDATGYKLGVTGVRCYHVIALLRQFKPDELSRSRYITSLSRFAVHSVHPIHALENLVWLLYHN
jgi:hypothetical protein